jgi:hypothetical protein
LRALIDAHCPLLCFTSPRTPFPSHADNKESVEVTAAREAAEAEAAARRAAEAAAEAARSRADDEAAARRALEAELAALKAQVCVVVGILIVGYKPHIHE